MSHDLNHRAGRIHPHIPSSKTGLKALRALCLLSFLLTLFSPVGSAQESPLHDELRQLRENVFQAYESRDLDALLAFVHPEVIATWQNGTRTRGHEELRKFYDEMMSGDKRIVRDVQSQLEVDGMSVLHGDETAIACGKLSDRFELSSGSTLLLKSQWTATVVKVDGKWLIASFHVSSSIFDNPILASLQSWMLTIAVSIGLIALLIGLLFGYVLAKSRSKA